MTYTILILRGFDILFNILFFRVGILFTLSVTRYHQISLIVCLWFPAVLTHTWPFSPTLGRFHPHPTVLTHPRPFSPTPGRFHPPPAVFIHTRHRPYPYPVVISYPRPLFPVPHRPCSPLIFVDTFPDIIPITCSVCPTPAVLTLTLPSSDAPYSPPHNSGRPPISPAVCINSHCALCLTIPKTA